MIVQAGKIFDYLDPKQTKFSLRQQNGQGFDLIDRWELVALVEQEAVCARVRGRKVRWIELIVPTGAAKKLIAQTRVKSESSQTILRQRVESAGADVRVFAHHPRCLRWREQPTAA